MDLVSWILLNRPGRMTRVDDRIEIDHESGESSIIWIKKNQAPIAVKNEELLEFYGKYDGATLFSSTFIIAAVDGEKSLGDVSLVFSLEKIQSEFDGFQVDLPENSRAFMYQAGIGYYAAGVSTSCIYEWDDEMSAVEEFTSVTEILKIWMGAVNNG